MRCESVGSHARTAAKPPPWDLPVAKMRVVSTQYCASRVSSMAVVKALSSVDTLGTPSQVFFFFCPVVSVHNFVSQKKKTVCLTSIPLGYTIM